MTPEPAAIRSPWIAVAGVCGVYFAFGLAATNPLLLPLAGDSWRGCC